MIKNVEAWSTLNFVLTFSEVQFLLFEIGEVLHVVVQVVGLPRVLGLQLLVLRRSANV